MRKTFLSLLLCLLMLLTPVAAHADCRARVCAPAVVHNAVAAVKVDTAIIATFATVPLFQVGYAPAAVQAQPVQQVQAAPDRLAKLEQDVARLAKENAELRAAVQGGSVQATAAARVAELAFLTESNSCVACHSATKKAGKLDLSNGLAGLTCEQLTAMLTRTYDKDAEDAMPPKASQAKHPPLTDKQYGELVKAVNAAMKTAKK